MPQLSPQSSTYPDLLQQGQWACSRALGAFAPPSLLAGPGQLESFVCMSQSWASLVAQMVKNLPAMWETWVRSLSWEDPLEDGMATHSIFA